MTDSATCPTSPVVCDDPSLSFSAYGTGWGTLHVIRETLGANTATPEQLLTAFESNREKIAVAVNRHTLPNDGRHILHDTSDF